MGEERKRRKAEREAAERAEYEASLERAREVAQYQQEHPGSDTAAYAFAFGVPGALFGAWLDQARKSADEKRAAVPPPDMPRPDAGSK
jgi:hypothetical protein